MSLSDFSELTELESSDEEDIPLSRSVKRQPPKAPSEYQIQNSLRPPRTSQYSAKSLYDQIVENTIDLDPEYQREVVWPESKQVGLIDSILRNYYIPPIIFAVTMARDGGETRTCIDGKQRLTSIQRFMDGLIPHKDSFTNVKMWYKQNAGSTKRKLLPKALKQAFANKQIVCVEYDFLSNDQEREIFQRVQLGMPLTPAERMAAISGELATLMREIQTDVQTGFEGYLEWGRARGRDFQCVTTIALLVDKFPTRTWPGVVQLESWLQKPEAVRKGFHEDIRNVFRTFLILVREKRFNVPFSKPTRVSPVEFVMIGVLIHAYRPKLSFMQLCSAIELMRADVRNKFDDIRGNTKVVKHMMHFISKKMKTLTLKGDGDDPPASRDHRYGSTQKTVKRKRTDTSDDDEPPAKTSASRGAASGSSSKAPITSSSKVSATPKQSTKPSISVAASSKTPARPSSSKQFVSAQVGKKTSPVSSVAVPRPSASQPSSRSVQIPRIPKVLGSASQPSTASSQVPPKKPAANLVPMQKQPPSALSPKPSPGPPSQTSTPKVPNTVPALASSATTSMQPPHVLVKQEPQNHGLGGMPTATPWIGSASAVPDRLAPIRAAKAAAGSQSPTIPSGGQGLRINTSNTSQVIPDPRKGVNGVSGQPASARSSTHSPLVPAHSPVITTPTFSGGVPLPLIDLEIFRRNGMTTKPPPTKPSAMDSQQQVHGTARSIAPDSSASDMSMSTEHSVNNTLGLNGPSNPSPMQSAQNVVPGPNVSNGTNDGALPSQTASVPSGPDGQIQEKNRIPIANGVNSSQSNSYPLPQPVIGQIPVLPPSAPSHSYAPPPPPDSASSHDSYYEDRHYPARQHSGAFDPWWDRDRGGSRDYRDYSSSYDRGRHRERGRGHWPGDPYSRKGPRGTSGGRYGQADRGRP